MESQGKEAAEHGQDINQLMHKLKLTCADNILYLLLNHELCGHCLIEFSVHQKGIVHRSLKDEMILLHCMEGSNQ
jgi:serine/threonine protein kinase